MLALSTNCYFQTAVQASNLDEFVLLSPVSNF